MAAPERITAPGIYDLTPEHYRGDCCAEPSITRSELQLLLRRPAKYWAHSPFNPDALPRKGKKAWDVGSAVHELILVGPEEFQRRNIILPQGVTLAHKEGKVIKAQAGTRRVLSWQDGETIKAMFHAFEADPLASVPFRRGLPERSLIWKDAETGVWLKIRPDFLPDRIGIIPEYKTTADAGAEAFQWDAYRYGYDLQAALYLSGIREVMGVTPDDYTFIMQEKEPPWLIEMHSLDDEWLEWAQLRLRYAIRLFADCLEKERWPGSTGEVHKVEMPFAIRKRLERAHEAGAFTLEAA